MWREYTRKYGYECGYKWHETQTQGENFEPGAPKSALEAAWLLDKESLLNLKRQQVFVNAFMDGAMDHLDSIIEFDGMKGSDS